MNNATAVLQKALSGLVVMAGLLACASAHATSIYFTPVINEPASAVANCRTTGPVYESGYQEWSLALSASQVTAIQNKLAAGSPVELRVKTYESARKWGEATAEYKLVIAVAGAISATYSHSGSTDIANPYNHNTQQVFTICKISSDRTHLISSIGDHPIS